MSRSKKLYLLLGIFLVVCIATFAVMGSEEYKEQIKNSGEIILELPDESVRSLSWEYSGKEFAFHKDENWLYDKDESFPVSEEKIKELLEPFQAFAAAFIIEEVEDLGQYGLDDPICVIKLSTAEQDYEIKLGDYSKMDSQRYVSVGDGNVYLAKHDPLEEFDTVLSDMIRHDEIPAFDSVSSIDFRHSEVIWADFADVSQIDISLEGNDYTITSEKKGKTVPIAIREKSWRFRISKGL